MQKFMIVIIGILISLFCFNDMVSAQSTTKDQYGRTIKRHPVQGQKATPHPSPTKKGIKKVKRTSPKGIEVGLGGLDFGFGALMHEMSFDAPAEYPDLKTDFGKSIHATIHTLRLSAPLGSPFVSFNTSLAFSFRNYAFSSNNTLVDNTNRLTFAPSTINYDVNCLRTTHLEVPLMIAFSNRPNQKNKSLKGGIGVYGSYMIGSKVKLKSEEAGKQIIKDGFSQNKLGYGVIGRLGYGPISLFAKYSLNSAFETDLGPDVRPFSVGLSIIP